MAQAKTDQPSIGDAVFLGQPFSVVLTEMDKMHLSPELQIQAIALMCKGEFKSDVATRYATNLDTLKKQAVVGDKYNKFWYSRDAYLAALGESLSNYLADQVTIKPRI